MEDDQSLLMTQMNNPSFTRGEYWILGAVAEHPIAIFWLLHENIEEALNRRKHGMSKKMLLLTMKKLISEGFIEIFQQDSVIIGNELAIENMEEYLSKDKQKKSKSYYYKLTQKGGKYWESFAFPNWEFYMTNMLSYFRDESDVGFFELISANKKYLEFYYRSLSYHEYNVIESSIQESTIKPWQATYWKELPIGYKMTFDCYCKENFTDIGVPEKNNMLFYKQIWCNWR
jgi:hypothetical protein